MGQPVGPALPAVVRHGMACSNCSLIVVSLEHALIGPDQPLTLGGPFAHRKVADALGLLQLGRVRVDWLASRSRPGRGGRSPAGCILPRWFLLANVLCRRGLVGLAVE